MSPETPDPDVAYCATLDAVTELLRGQARTWAAQLRLVGQLDTLAAKAARGTAEFLQLEMAGSWSIGQLTATRWQWEALRMHDALPRTLAMLERGDLLVHQATVLLHGTRSCTPPVARAVEAAVLPAGAELVPADLRRRVARTVLQIESEQADPAAAQQRHTDAATQRHTFSKPLQDGLGLAGAVLTAEQLLAWQQGLDQLERRERCADRDHGVARTAEQRRADLFAALPAMVLAGTAQDRATQDRAGQDRAGQDRAAHPAPDGPGQAGQRGGAPASGGLRPWTLGPQQITAQIVLHVHVPVATVLDLSRAPGSLDRYGPVSAEHVRLLRPHSWRRVLVDATSGRPLALDDHLTPAPAEPEQLRQQVLDRLTPEVVTDTVEPQHDPSARLARLVDVRDVHCCGPGCSSTNTHRDHLDPWPAGPTCAANLGRLSPRCHRAKHAGWTLVRHPDGSTTWTSPVGRTYSRPSPHTPPPHVDLFTQPPPAPPRPPTPIDSEQPEDRHQQPAAAPPPPTAAPPSPPPSPPLPDGHPDDAPDDLDGLDDQPPF